MVKGVSRQVIVVQSPDRKLFEQAIFILRDEAVAQGITDEMLLKEAKRAVRSGTAERVLGRGPVWAAGGAAVMGLVWILTGVV